MERRGTRKPVGPLDGLSLIKAEHDKVLSLFLEFEALQGRLAQDDGRKAGMVERICSELTLHAALEEQAFYPALRAAAGGSAQLDDALVEHEAAHLLIAQLASMYPDDEQFGITVAVLGEETRHHMEQEEGAVFDCARSCGMNLQLLADQLIERRRVLHFGGRITGGPLNGSHPGGLAGTAWEPRLPD